MDEANYNAHAAEGAETVSRTLHADDEAKAAKAAFANPDPFYSPENQERLTRAKERMEQTGGAVCEPSGADGD